ncbi:hypothetical protein D3C77_633660 [compost metagenome]
MPVHPTADGQFVEHARQAVAGEGLQAVARRQGGDAFILIVGGQGIGVPRRRLPAVGQLAIEFHLQAFGGGVLFGLVDIVVLPDRQVVLFKLEQRQARVQLAIVMTALDPDFVANAFHRIEWLVVFIGHP